MGSQLNKEAIREKLKKIRDSLSEDRRKEASKALFHSLLDTLCSFTTVLSYSSFQSELDTTLLNHYLSRTGRLYLPKMVEGSLLEIYHVSDLKHLKQNAAGIYEPDPNFCKKVSEEIIQVALVPALGFDKDNFRIGYGRGYYDRFLLNIPHCKTIGIGYREQMIKSLPIEKSDLALSQISLF